jgi:ribosomal protein L14
VDSRDLTASTHSLTFHCQVQALKSKAQRIKEEVSRESGIRIQFGDEAALVLVESLKCEVAKLRISKFVPLESRAELNLIEILSAKPSD